MEPTPVPSGALVQMWRAVYQKAADAAEGRFRQLLADHVYGRHGRRALAVVFGCGAGAIPAGTACHLEAPWAYVIEGWALYADAPGSLSLSLEKSAGYATYPGDLTSLTGAGVPPTLAAARKNRSEDVTGWTTALPRGAILRVEVDSASGLTAATLTLLVRAV